MFWLGVVVLILVRLLRLRWEVLVALPCLLAGLVWLTKAEKTGAQLAVVLTVVVLVAAMRWAEYRCHYVQRSLRCNR